MPVSEQLLEILRCPRTKVPLRPLSADELQKVNELVTKGALKYYDGNPVDKPLEEGLITTDKATIYRVDESIPVMLIEMGIPADQIPGL